MNVLIGGDVYFGGSLEKLSIESPEILFDDIRERYASADISIINLESPLTSTSQGIKKTGPNIKASEESIAALNYLKVDLVTLANNHIMDYGLKGLEDTLDLCHQHNIDTVGAGIDNTQAAEPHVRQVGDKKVAIVNFAENEWSSADNDQGGANPMDVVSNARQIQYAKSIADHVIVIVHGGHEHYEYPSPRMINSYRFYVEQGASAVVGHHAHCVSGYELYQESPIIYNIGNLLFESSTKDKRWFEGMLVELNISEKIDFELIPYYQCREGEQGIKLMNGQERGRFFEKLKGLSNSIHNGELEKKWTALVEKEYMVRRRQLLSKTSFFHRVLGKLNLLEPFLDQRQSRLMLNLMRCEAHRDISIGALELFEKKEK